MILNAIIFTILYFILNEFFIRNNIFLDKVETSKHKNNVATNNKTPLTGGLILIIFLLFTPIVDNKILIFSILSIYVLGLLSDLNILTSPSKRIFFQIIIIVSFIIVGSVEVKTISIGFFDQMLKSNTFNIIFLLSCLLVLVNGSNFLDGLNTLVVTYYILCLSTIFISAYHYNLNLDYEIFKSILMILTIVFLFNFFGKSFFGDSGTYSLAFLIGTICIKFIYENPQAVSPYFIALLLWYPATENLFSIVRRVILKKNLSVADNLHLHHLIYLFFLKKKYFTNKVFTNSFSGIFINLYNLIIVLISFFFINNSKILILIIFFNLLIFFFTYVLLRKLFLSQK